MKMRDLLEKLEEINKPVNEAQVNINMTADSCDEVGELMKLMTNAGLKPSTVSSAQMDDPNIPGKDDVPGDTDLQAGALSGAVGGGLGNAIGGNLGGAIGGAVGGGVKGAIGSTLGGLVGGPVGSAIGGAIGGAMNDSPNDNPDIPGKDNVPGDQDLQSGLAGQVAGAIRGEGTSNDYFPIEVPAMPSFSLQRAISSALKFKKTDYWTGTIFTTNRRVWEFDIKFKKYLKKVRAYSIDMETATLFTVGFHNRIPTGALLLVTDQPMIPDGIKTKIEDDKNSKLYDKNHLELGIASLNEIIKYDDTNTVRHLKF